MDPNNITLLAEIIGFIRGHLTADKSKDVVIPNEVAIAILEDYWRYNKNNGKE
mgnify:CR=1 FL=1